MTQTVTPTNTLSDQRLSWEASAALAKKPNENETVTIRSRERSLRLLMVVTDDRQDLWLF